MSQEFTIFRPVRGTDSKISIMPITDGYVYYAYDSGRIYMDSNGKRHSMGGVGGGSGSAIYYGIAGNSLQEDPETKKYQYLKTLLEDKNAVPRVDDIILDSTGAFYRITKIETDYYECVLLSVSGTGNTTVIRPNIKILDPETTTIINGQDFDLQFIVSSYLDENENPYDTNMKVYWSLIDASTEQPYYTGIPLEKIGHNQTVTLSLGDYLKDSTSTVIQLYATGNNHAEKSVTRSIEITTVEMYLQQTSSYNPAYTYNTDNTVLECNVIGNLSKIIEWTFDGKVLKTETLNANSTNPRQFAVSAEYATHGYHTIEINLYQNLGTATNPIKGLPAEPLKYEIAIVKANDSTQSPIIWLGDYQETYYNYDTIQIPFLVYNPANTAKAEVRLYKNDIEIDGSPRTITDFSAYNYWEIADAELNKENYYSIACGPTPETSVVREIIFTVEQDPNRDMTIVKQSNLKLNFDPAGRSNSEPATKRSSWSYGEGESKINGVFENFNWYNNGWYSDSETKNTFLRISNGAKFFIPFGNLEFATNDSSKQSNSIEIALKIRNIQNYSNLITNITRYKNDDNWFKNFEAQNKYTNYDAYLQATLTPEQYEALEFDKVQKNLNLKYVTCGFYSGDENSVVGVCVGPQDTFFSNGENTVNVSFVENEMVYLSFVYDHNLKLLFIYINGVITGVIRSTKTDNTGFKINADNIIFNSEYCDIDLYKIRIYNTNLSVNDIVTNHAVDKKDIVIYDQNNLAEENNVLKEYQLNYNKIISYNNEHPEEPLMPYIVFDTTNSNTDNKLPYAKAIGTIDIQTTFVNAPLDAAYARGELVSYAIKDGLLSPTETDQDVIDEAVKTYYKHHCPSWTSTMSGGDVVTIEVQGTSSEFYPRRNFKIKTKYKKNNSWGEIEEEDGTITEGWTEDETLNIFLNKGPFEDVYKQDQKLLAQDPYYYGYEESRMADGWYMNNYTNPTDRWTMKVDFMESSGSYNAGFASLVGNAYTKHPLQDYVNAGVLTNTNKLESSVTNGMRWQDFRTSLLGFPIMAFQKRGDNDYVFIGYYRMLLDKGSDQVLGFKTPKAIEHKLVNNQRLRDVAECWEFSTNARTFCSYRDPWNRVELSFKAPRSEGDDGFIKLASGNIGGPVVLNHFEPRYFWAEDYLKNDENGFYNFGDLTQNIVNNICDELNITRISISDPEAKYLAQDAAVDLLKNWEKVCKWIWSTNLDNVKSQGTYQLVPVGLVEYQEGTYYIIDESQESGYALAYGEFDPEQTYYKKSQYTETDENGISTTYDKYENAYATLKEYIYAKNKFYTYVEINGVKTYSLSTSENFDTTSNYYIFNSMTDDKIAEIADLLVAPATEYIEGTQYYTYNAEAKVSPENGITGAVQLATVTDATIFSQGDYYVASPVTYANTTYKYDTQEYRTAKFINELTQHFDPEYLATYFIMTEVFECYDSRGKNCMMASWGPQKSGGEYIWYPIFYDIDTQLGINNTGIPSFEFNVDATEAGNFSTSDSILWNNFYKFFKGSYILSKYQNLRGKDSSFEKLVNPPLQSVDYLEGWYSFDPNTTQNIANKGKRPLIATNLDMYFKYITITNDAADDAGQLVAPLTGDGKYFIDTGSYFYALQGDRSQSRRQFLGNRLEYTDSWLGQGNYIRGGNNRIRGRLSANSLGSDPTTSDIWVETETDPYWVNGTEFGTKTHDLDAEYWLTLQPIRSSYVTAGDDSANYPSKKYDGINAINFKLNDIENGIRRSSNYPEQLVYIYGMNQMADFGELNNLYLTEFYMEGEANHLTRLQLGYDGLSKTDEGKNWFNKKLNGITLVDMPLLKEANFSNIGIQEETNLDLSKSEKLENFRAAGTSNLTGVKFAEGVALNTLYLPSSVKSLELIQANLLDNVIAESTRPLPVNNEDGTTSPPTPGLYLEGFFGDSFTSSITSINLDGGALKYGSYQILKQFYNNVKNKTGTYRITMTNVNWSPYIQLTEGAVYDPTEENYYIDDKHYGFKAWTKNEEEFDNLILNGQLYKYQKTSDVVIDEDFINLLIGLKETNFADASSNSSYPIISGIVYIENSSKAYEESYIRDELQILCPDLKLFFKTVEKAYSAEFLMENPETGAFEYVPMVDGSNTDSVQKISQNAYKANTEIWFTSPFGNLDEDQDGDPDGLYKPLRTHYDFAGWSTDPTSYQPEGTDPNGTKIITNTSDWNALRIDPEIFDYTYYAIFTIHSYPIVFYDGDGTVLEEKQIAYGTYGIDSPSTVPYLDDSTLSPIYMTYGFKGYTDNTLTNKIVDLSKFTVRNTTKFYPVFEEMSVYNNIHPEYFTIDAYGDLSLIKQVQGKITIPATLDYKDPSSGLITTKTVLSLNSSFAAIKHSSSSYTAFGQKLTHVFFDLNTQINSFGLYCFHAQGNVGNLIYVEFPDTLTSIGDYAFFNCAKLDYSQVKTDISNWEYQPRIDGTNISYIGSYAFARAFNTTNLSTLQIGPKVTTIGMSSFNNIGSYSPSDLSKKYELIVGLPGELSNLSIGNSAAFAKMTSVTFYTANYSDIDDKMTTFFGTSNISLKNA